MQLDPQQVPLNSNPNLETIHCRDEEIEGRLLDFAFFCEYADCSVRGTYR